MYEWAGLGPRNGHFQGVENVSKAVAGKGTSSLSRLRLAVRDTGKNISMPSDTEPVQEERGFSALPREY